MNINYPQNYTDARIKHLEMIKEIINHYVDCSARVKNLTIFLVLSLSLGYWIGVGTIFVTAIVPILTNSNELINSENSLETVASAVLHVAPSASKVAGLFIILFFGLTFVVCCILDAHYSNQAKLYCEFYDSVRIQPLSKKTDFCINLDSRTRRKQAKWSGFGKTITLYFYFVLILYLAVFYFLTGTTALAGLLDGLIRLQNFLNGINLPLL